MKNFELLEEGEFSLLLQESGIVSFNDACRFIADINYGRITNAEDISLVFHERKGTCSSKHAFLKAVAEEQGNTTVKLMMGVFKMSGASHPKLKELFAELPLDYIPEVHIYLQVDNQRQDFTSKNPFNISQFLLEENEVDLDFVLFEKIEFHQEFISDWNTTEYSDDALWELREKCINILSK